MSRFRVYIKPFDSVGNYADDFIEVTSDVNSNTFNFIKESIDNNEFSVGLFKYSTLNLTLNNIDGFYSDVGNPKTIFSYKRSDSIVKITWNLSDDIEQCGVAICGDSFLTEEVEIYRGLLNDETLSLDIGDQKNKFKVLGLESIFTRVEAPYSSINIGDDISDIIYTCLNQSEITNILTLSVGNINVGNDNAIDNKDDLENVTVKEALDLLLEASNSVLYIKDQTIYVSDRAASASVQATFYGQASENGIENIINITNIVNGLRQLWNYWTWADVSNISKDTTSIDLYGIRKNEIDYSIITNSTKIDDILDYYKTEFSTAKQKFDITVPITYDNLNVFILDKVSIDYPTVFRRADDSELPIYGVSVYGTAKYPIGEWSFEVNSTDYYKILERKIDLKNQTIQFTVRLI